MNNTSFALYDFPECDSIVVSGDIHGDFNLLVNKMCVQYQMRNTLLIVAGDCGFGFEKKDYYENMVRRNVKRINEHNNWILFLRGNHDNPAYFDGTTFKHKRFIAIPDYSVVKAKEHTILCVGGAISIDRHYRIEVWEQKQKKLHKYTHKTSIEDKLQTNYYWVNEAPNYNEDLLSMITAAYQVDTIITHTAPSFCELQSKSGLTQWAANDEHLLVDVQKERETMDAVYEKMKGTHQPISHWFYGHFHQSWHSSIEGVLFRMLDIMEFYEIR